MDEDEAASSTGPGTLIEKEVAKAVVNITIVILLESLRLMGGGANDDVGAVVDKGAEKIDLIASGRIGIVAGGVFASVDVFVALIVLYIDNDEVSTFFGGGDVGLGFGRGVKIGTRSIV